MAVADFLQQLLASRSGQGQPAAPVGAPVAPVDPAAMGAPMGAPMAPIAPQFPSTDPMAVSQSLMPLQEMQAQDQAALEAEQKQTAMSILLQNMQQARNPAAAAIQTGPSFPVASGAPAPATPDATAGY